MEDLEFIQDITCSLQHTTIVETLPKKVGQQHIWVHIVLKSLTVLDLLSPLKFLLRSWAVRYNLYINLNFLYCKDIDRYCNVAHYHLFCCNSLC